MFKRLTRAQLFNRQTQRIPPRKPLFWSIIGLFSSLSLSLISSSLHALPPPTEFETQYIVTKGIFTIGKTTRRLIVSNNGEFRFESHTKPAGLTKWITSGEVNEISVWTLHQEQYRPLRYTYQNTGGDKERNVELIFNWEEMKVRNIINGDPWEMDINNNTTDKLLYQLALMYELREQQNEYQYSLADGGKLKELTVTVVGEELLETKLGALPTVKLVKISKKSKTFFWCAKQYNYIPVRIEKHKKSGDAIVAEIEKIKGIAAAPNQ